MTYTTPGYVVGLRSLVLPRVVFTLVLLYGIWFTIVLLGEQQAVSDDPARWAVLPTTTWAWMGLALFVVAALYFLVLLVRREVPGTTYRLNPPAGEGTAPAYLQGDAPPPPQS